MISNVYSLVLFQGARDVEWWWSNNQSRGDSWMKVLGLGTAVMGTVRVRKNNVSLVGQHSVSFFLSDSQLSPLPSSHKTTSGWSWEKQRCAFWQLRDRGYATKFYQTSTLLLWPLFGLGSTDDVHRTVQSSLFSDQPDCTVHPVYIIHVILYFSLSQFCQPNVLT